MKHDSHLHLAFVATLWLSGCALQPGVKLVYPQGGAGKSPEVKIEVAGHVKNDGQYRVARTPRTPLDEIIRQAGGFDPMAEYAKEKTSDVAWIERALRGRGYQLIILDYRNHQILSQRRVDDGKWRLERCEWQDFEFAAGDSLFVTTSRDSLDLAGYPVRGVGPKGWPGIEKLRLFGMTKEETDAFEQARGKKTPH